MTSRPASWVAAQLTAAKWRSFWATRPSSTLLSNELPRLSHVPAAGSLVRDALNWGPYLWMRCYNNGAQFLDQLLGPKPDWKRLEQLGRRTKPAADGCHRDAVRRPEPSLKIAGDPKLLRSPREPQDRGQHFCAALEALVFPHRTRRG